jgi:hypothetical protein
LDRIIDREMTVLIGDANGADRAVQAHFASRGYNSVIVYCSKGVCRNNMGNWEVRWVDTDAPRGTRDFYRAKDLAMARDANFGFMIWDGRSLGTLNNLITLIEQRKVITVYVTSDGRFHDLNDHAQVEHFLEDFRIATRTPRLSHYECSLFECDPKSRGGTVEPGTSNA